MSWDCRSKKARRSQMKPVELTLNGQDAKIISQSGENLFSTFYQTLIGIRIDGFDLAASRMGL